MAPCDRCFERRACTCDWEPLECTLGDQRGARSRERPRAEALAQPVEQPRDAGLRGQPQQAAYYLERVARSFPGSLHAQRANARLVQLRGAPPETKH